MKRLTDSQVISRTAQLAVACGLGGPECLKGKVLHLYHSNPAYPLMLAIAKEAYKAGVVRVDYTTWSPPADALHVRYATDKSLINIPRTWSDRWNDLVRSRSATLRIEGTDEPLALANCDAKRVSDLTAARIHARKRFYKEGLAPSRTPWSIVPFATEGWGKLVFPRLSAEKGRQRLQDAFVDILELQHPDFIERWKARGKRIERRSKLLDKANIKALRFVGPGTDLTVGLSEKARFGGGMMYRGRRPFFANLPTFENFTTPHKDEANGVVRMTRPILINGQVVDGLRVWFKNGKVQKFTARRGAKAFAAMLKTDEGASFLGEVALVGINDSRIFQTGIVFKNILLDENAACHIAFGRAYPDRLAGGVRMSKTQRAKHGCNDSKVHLDCMISDKNTTVYAILRDGRTIKVLENGAWVGQFAPTA
ncbi:MAG: aminopeptidase [Deltaproteobacteria bacterium]|nr:aminopeptidase [Deltaproteobacteria bacterium]